MTIKILDILKKEVRRRKEIWWGFVCLYRLYLSVHCSCCSTNMLLNGRLLSPILKTSGNRITEVEKFVAISLDNSSQNKPPNLYIYFLNNSNQRQFWISLYFLLLIFTEFPQFPTSFVKDKRLSILSIFITRCYSFGSNLNLPSRPHCFAFQSSPSTPLPI